MLLSDALMCCRADAIPLVLSTCQTYTVVMARGCRASFLLYGAMMPWQIMLCEMQLTQLCPPVLPLQRVLSSHAWKTLRIGFNVIITHPVYFLAHQMCSNTVALHRWMCIEFQNGYIRSSPHLSNIFLCMFCFFAGFVFKLLHFVALLPPSLSLSHPPPLT